jgi:hypothetical protein
MNDREREKVAEVVGRHRHTLRDWREEAIKRAHAAGLSWREADEQTPDPFVEIAATLAALSSQPSQGDESRDLFWMARRYAHGRHTYAPGIIERYVQRHGLTEDKTIECVKAESRGRTNNDCLCDNCLSVFALATPPSPVEPPDHAERMALHEVSAEATRKAVARRRRPVEGEGEDLLQVARDASELPPKAFFDRLRDAVAPADREVSE